MAKLYKIKLVKQQSFIFSHNLLEKCLVPSCKIMLKNSKDNSAVSVFKRPYSVNQKDLLKWGRFRE